MKYGKKRKMKLSLQKKCERVKYGEKQNKTQKKRKTFLTPSTLTTKIANNIKQNKQQN